LIEVDGLPVANDGTVPFRSNERIMLSYMLTNKFLGETIGVKVLRPTFDPAQPPVQLEFEIRLDKARYFLLLIIAPREGTLLALVRR
jgi:hypothetical protein